MCVFSKESFSLLYTCRLCACAPAISVSPPLRKGKSHIKYTTQTEVGPRNRHLTMGNSRSKSKGTRRDGKEHAAPSTSATGQVVPPTATTVKKQIATEPNKVDDHGGQTPAGASRESQLHSPPNFSPATSAVGGVYTNEESTTAPSSSIIQQATMTAASTTRQVLGCPLTGTIEKQFITENKADDHGGQISTGAHSKSQLHAGDVSTAGGSISSTQLVASCLPSGASSIIARSSGITQQATIISSAHGTPGEKIKGVRPVDVMSATISPLLGDSRDSEGSQSKSDSAQKIALSSSTAMCQGGNTSSSSTTQQTTSSTELAMKANVEGANNMVDTNTSSPLRVNDSLEPAGGAGHTKPDKPSTDSTKLSPSTGTSTGGVREEQDMEGSGIN